MNLLTLFLWVVGLVSFGAVFLVVFGAVLMDLDLMKGNRFLANMHDRHPPR